MQKFSQAAKEALKYYVYCLVDPRDNTIFYIGKGKGDRIFNHVNASIKGTANSDKLDKIKDIINAGEKVVHYILRHGLSNETALEIESTLIDIFKSGYFNNESTLTNIDFGHHKWTKGIKTINDIELDYGAKDFKLLNKDDRIIFININKTYVDDTNIYDAAKGDWPLSMKKANNATHILVHYKGIVRAVFEKIKWKQSPTQQNKLYFVGDQIEDCPYQNMESPYLKMNISKLKLSKYRGACYYNF